MWEYVRNSGGQFLRLTFEEIHNITGISIDHSFLKYKKELTQYGYQAGKISMKEETVTLAANSIGTFFSMSSLDETLVDKAYFISPVVDMEQLIGNIMMWAGVTEQELAEKLEIPTEFGETLSWKYLTYVREQSAFLASSYLHFVR